MADFEMLLGVTQWQILNKYYFVSSIKSYTMFTAFLKPFINFNHFQISVI